MVVSALVEKGVILLELDFTTGSMHILQFVQ